MIRWGAAVPEGDDFAIGRPRCLGRPSSAAKPGAPSRGPGIQTESCQSATGLASSEQQRLAVAGWRREVDSGMIGWGARVDPADKELLVAYLAGRFAVGLNWLRGGDFASMLL